MKNKEQSKNKPVIVITDSEDNAHNSLLLHANGHVKQTFATLEVVSKFERLSELHVLKCIGIKQCTCIYNSESEG